MGWEAAASDEQHLRILLMVASPHCADGGCVTAAGAERRQPVTSSSCAHQMMAALPS